MPEAFTKYDKGGAYHWKWYLVNYGGYQEFSNWLVDLFPAKGRILDVGCGDGLIAYLFFRSGFEVVGFDTSELAINLARVASETAIRNEMGANIVSLQGMPFVKGTSATIRRRFAKHELKYKIQSIYDLDESESFDYAVCCEVIEHIEEPGTLIKNIHRAIRKFAIITTPNGLRGDGAIDAPGPYDYHVWSPETFALLFEHYQFEFIVSRPSTISIKLYK